MLRFIFCLAVILPIFFIPSLTGDQNAVAEIEIEENSYDNFTDNKISALSKCEPESIPIYFSDRYVESHSAAFLHEAIEAASSCREAQAHIVSLKFENMDEADKAMSNVQFEEVAEFLKAYNSDIAIDDLVRETELDTRAVNGRSVVVEFEFNSISQSAQAGQ